ncbi:8018_t:CDS:2 [Entrophospora sp. SA101]|nr:8018_t:CDS:2 [Entrophospora sp. SA101]
MNKILTIDPSGTGTSGICLISDKRIEFNSITVNTVKPFKDKLFSGQEQLEGLSCLAGREINKEYFRTDLPQLEVGDKVEIITKNFKKSEKDKYRLTHFKGTVIAQKNKQRISYNFSVLKESKGSDKVAIRGIFSYHSPLIMSIKKLGKINQKIRRAKLYYLERELAKKKDNE